MEPNQLMAKDGSGKVLPFTLSGVMHVDGSIKADLPHQRLSELFNVNQFIVSQVNPHVAPFLPAEYRHSHHRHNIFRQLEKFINTDIMTRLKKLIRLKLLPRLFGRDIGDIVNQRYAGTVNIYPPLGLRDTFKAIQNPTNEAMKEYIEVGEKSTWLRHSMLSHHMAYERKLDALLRELVASNPTGNTTVSTQEFPSPSNGSWHEFKGGQDKTAAPNIAVAVAVAGGSPDQAHFLEGNQELNMALRDLCSSVLDRRPAELNAFAAQFFRNRAASTSPSSQRSMSPVADTQMFST